ncbi:MAG: LysE family translocator [Limisphaerales bacterium]
METLLAMLLITGAVALGAVSPGPSFVLVARTAVAGSRSHGLAMALGIGLGGVVFVVAALLGLHLLFNSVAWLGFAFKLLGGVYLILLGILIWRAARQPAPLPEAGAGPRPGTAWRAFGLGFLTQVSNPKAVVIYASILAALLPREVPRLVPVVLPPLIFLVEAGWYAVVALLLSAPAPRALYGRAKVWVDRLAGGVLVLLGLRLLAGVWPT